MKKVQQFVMEKRINGEALNILHLEIMLILCKRIKAVIVL